MSSTEKYQLKRITYTRVLLRRINYGRLNELHTIEFSETDFGSIQILVLKWNGTLNVNSRF